MLTALNIVMWPMLIWIGLVICYPFVLKPGTIQEALWRGFRLGLLYAVLLELLWVWRMSLL